MIDVYVPGPNCPISIVDGSGIVGCRHKGDLIEIYFEGNIYGASELRPHLARVRHAYFRMREHYPTVARAVVPATELTHVGYYDEVSDELHITNQPELDRWLGKGVGAVLQ